MPFVVGAGSFLLFLSLAVNIIALLVPYWYVIKALGTHDLNFGLWGSCTCRWYYSSLGSAIDDQTVKGESMQVGNSDYYNNIYIQFYILNDLSNKPGSSC